MSDIIRNGILWFAAQLAKFASRTVVYRQGAIEVSVQAVLGRGGMSRDIGGGAKIESTSREYLVPAPYLVYDEDPILPKRGDKIIDVDGTYEVAPEGETTGYGFSDPYGLIWRLHTKRVS